MAKYENGPYPDIDVYLSLLAGGDGGGEGGPEDAPVWYPAINTGPTIIYGQS